MRTALLTGLLALLLAGSAHAGPQKAPPGLPTVSAGPAVASPYGQATFGTPFKGYGGYRIGQDGQFHGYGVFGRKAEPRREARLSGRNLAAPSTGFAPPIAAQGEVLASSILANQYAPAYGVLNIGYGAF